MRLNYIIIIYKIVRNNMKIYIHSQREKLKLNRYYTNKFTKEVALFFVLRIIYTFTIIHNSHTEIIAKLYIIIWLLIQHVYKLYNGYRLC